MRKLTLTALLATTILTAAPALAANDSAVIDYLNNNKLDVTTDNLNNAMLDMMNGNTGNGGAPDNQSDTDITVEKSSAQNCSDPTKATGQNEDGQDGCLNNVAPAAGDDGGDEETSDGDSGDFSNEQPNDEKEVRDEPEPVELPDEPPVEDPYEPPAEDPYDPPEEDYLPPS